MGSNAGVWSEGEGEFGRCARGGGAGRSGGQSQVVEDIVYGLGLGEEGDDAQLTAAGGTEQREDFVNTSEKPSRERGCDSGLSG